MRSTQANGLCLEGWLLGAGAHDGISCELLQLSPEEELQGLSGIGDAPACFSELAYSAVSSACIDHFSLHRLDAAPSSKTSFCNSGSN